MKIEIPYRIDSKINDRYLMRLIALTIFGILLIILIKNIWITLAIVVWFVLYFMHLPLDGEIQLKIVDDTLYYIDSFEESEDWQRVKHIDYYWSNNFLVTGKGGEAGRNSTTHYIFIQLAMVITNLNNEKIAIIKELNQWQSTPNDWDYAVFKSEEFIKVVITSKNLLKIKRKLPTLRKD